MRVISSTNDVRSSKSPSPLPSPGLPGEGEKSLPGFSRGKRKIIDVGAAGFAMRLICKLTAIVTLCSTVAAAEPEIGSTARPFPDTSNRIRVYADQFPSQLNDAQWKFIATHYVGGQKQTRTWVRTIRRLNPGFLMLHYQLALGAGPAKIVIGDQWTSDADLIDKHEDWFVHDAAGHRLQQKQWAWNVMNIGFEANHPKTGFPRYWVDSALSRMRENEDDGVFADSYTQDILMLQTDPGGFPSFTDVETCKSQWLPGLNAYGHFIERQFQAAPERFYFLPNLGALQTKWDNVTRLDVGDGGMVEGFASPGSGRSYSVEDWKLQMTRVLALAAKNKIILCQSYIDPRDTNQRWFVIGSHLLTKGRHSFVNMFEKSSLEWYPEYEVKLGDFDGPPQTDVSRYWDTEAGVFRRAFAHGEVLVNPDERAASIRFAMSVRLIGATGGGLFDGHKAWSSGLTTTTTHDVEIPPHSARVVMIDR
jgi:hypothetical protein